MPEPSTRGGLCCCRNVAGGPVKLKSSWVTGLVVPALTNELGPAFAGARPGRRAAGVMDAAAKIVPVGLNLVASDWQFCYNEIAFVITWDVVIHFGYCRVEP
jgi:hypothetical protein